MQKPIIEVKNIGKSYKIRHEKGKYIALRDVIAHFFKNPLSVFRKQNKEEFWALRNVSFDVHRGEVIGIIGHNGAGKSTLLKILSQITPPTTGEIKIHGKVGSLLEVGTGFHPELTGRENIFLNGAILGMSRADIAKNFDAIVAFAGIEKFLDTPVKYYSSGMYVRLAFSVAAHMEPDILLVDEVLAVGDMEFQKKCLGKMEEVTKKDGRTILFVSHNMAAIQNLCERSILLNNGEVVAIGNTHEIIEKYLSYHTESAATLTFEKDAGADVAIREIKILNEEKQPRTDLLISTKNFVEITFECEKDIHNATLSALFYSSDRDLILYSSEADSTGSLFTYTKGVHKKTIEIPAFLFSPGLHSLDVMVHSPNIKMFAQKKHIGFEIKNINNPRSIIFHNGGHVGKVAHILHYA